MKRPAASPSGGSRKRSAMDPVAGKVQTVAETLAETPAYPEVVIRMLAGAVPKSLGVYKDVRHPFQSEIIGMTKQVLTCMEECAVKQVAQMQAAIDETLADQKQKTTDCETLEQVVGEKEPVVSAAKSALAEVKPTETAAKAALKEAMAVKKKEDAEFNRIQAKLRSFEEVLKDKVCPLKTDEGGDLKALLKFCKKEEFETLLLGSVDTALRKKASERGQFDEMVIGQLEEQFEAKMAPLKEKMAAENPGVASRQAKVEECKMALEGAEAIAQTKKEELEAATEALNEAETNFQSALELSEDSAKPIKEAEKQFNSSSNHLAELRATIEVFNELETHSTPTQIEEPEESAPSEEPLHGEAFT